VRRQKEKGEFRRRRPINRDGNIAASRLKMQHVAARKLDRFKLSSLRSNSSV